MHAYNHTTRPHLPALSTAFPLLCRHVDSKTGRVVEPFGRIPYEAVTAYSGWVDNINTTDSTK